MTRYPMTLFGRKMSLPLSAFLILSVLRTAWALTLLVCSTIGVYHFTNTHIHPQVGWLVAAAYILVFTRFFNNGVDKSLLPQDSKLRLLQVPLSYGFFLYAWLA